MLKSRASIIILSGVLALAPVTAAAFDSFAFQTPGAPEDLAGRLRAASVVAPLADQGNDDSQELLAAARAEYSRLLGTLYNQGYYGGIITVTVDGREAAAIPPFETPARIRSLVVEVRPGPRYTFSRATVDPLAPGTELPGAYAVGEPARTSAIRTSAQAAVTGWRRLGYAKADVTDQRIVADHRATTVTSDLRLSTGPKLSYGTLVVRGAERVREERILQMSGLRRAPQVFNPDELRKAANRIRRSGAFRSVAVTEAETPNADGTIDITLQVAEQRPRRYGIGLAFSTVEGPSLEAFWLHRNLLGGAERLRIEGQWSSIGGEQTGGEDYRISARFTRTGSFGPDTDFYIFTEVEQLNEPDFSSNSASFELGYTRIASDVLSVGVGLGYRFVSVTENGDTTEYQMITLPLQVTYDSRDDILNATSGLFGGADLTPFVGLSETDDGVRFYGDGRAYFTAGEAVPVTFAGRVQVGSILNARLDRVPNDMRFYSGGGGTVRGQPYQSLGVQLGGRTSGGASFLGLSAEARAAVTGTIGVVAFADFGVVGSDPFPEDWDNSHSGAGLGLRYNTPVGPLRVDVAVPVSGDTDTDDFSFYIGIGQTF